MTDKSTKCTWVIHEGKAVQIHVHNNRRCLFVPRVPGSAKICTTTTRSAQSFDLRPPQSQQLTNNHDTDCTDECAEKAFLELHYGDYPTERL